MALPLARHGGRRTRRTGVLAWGALAFAALMAGCTLLVTIDPDVTEGDALQADAADRSVEAGEDPDAHTARDAHADAAVDGDAAKVDTGPIIFDTFTRDVVSELGVAEIGGPWTELGGPVGGYNVRDGGAVLSADAGQGLNAILREAPARDVDVTGTWSLDALPGGSGIYMATYARSVSNGLHNYNLQTRVTSSGTITPRLLRDDVGIKDGTAISGTYVPRTSISFHLQIYGINPTHLRAKVWHDGAEPGQWNVEVTDTTADLQTTGSNGFSVYLSGSAATGVNAMLDDFVVREL